MTVPFAVLLYNPSLCAYISLVVVGLLAAQMESWLAQTVLFKQKRGGSSSRYYATGMNGPPSSVSEDRVRVHRYRQMESVFREEAEKLGQTKDIQIVVSRYLLFFLCPGWPRKFGWQTYTRPCCTVI